MRCPSARNTTAEGTMKNAMRSLPETIRCRSTSSRVASPATSESSGSSAAATDIANRLIGSR